MAKKHIFDSRVIWEHDDGTFDCAHCFPSKIIAECIHITQLKARLRPSYLRQNKVFTTNKVEPKVPIKPRRRFIQLNEDKL